MRKMLSKALTVTALAGSAMLVSTPASADLLTFFVNEDTVPGANVVPDIEVDLLNGRYTELITFDGVGGFVTTAFAVLTQYAIGDGVTPGLTDIDTQLGSLGGPANEYRIYAMFTATGTVAPDGSGFAFTGTSASAEVWLDPDSNTTATFGATASDPIALANDGSDYRLLDANTLYAGRGFLLPGVGGFFDIIFSDPTLTDFGTLLDGNSYWTGLPLFNFIATIDGDLNTFALTGTQTIAGDVSIVFETIVPEPATLTLFGAGLLGAAVLARRRRKV